MKIKLYDSLSQEYSNHLFHWRQRVFPEEGKDFEWAKSKWHILAFNAQDMPCAHLGYRDFNVVIDGQRELNVVGIGGVVVRPEAQGRNIPAKLFDFLHNSSHAKLLSNTFSLFCPKRLERYYNKQGYIKFEGAYTFRQKGKLTKTDKFTLMYRGDLIEARKIHVPGDLW